MDAPRLLEALRADVDHILAISADDLGKAVAACPGWSVDDLIGHCAAVFANVSAQIEAGPGAELQDRPSAPVDGLGYAWFEREANRLLAHLADLDPDEHRPNWAGQPTSYFWFRRMAHELAIHRWDAQAATSDSPQPIPADIAVDGVDELFDTFLVPFAKHRGITGTGESVHLHATDVGGDTGVAGGEWTIRFIPDGLEVEHSHDKGDMAGRGTASDLMLFCWNRRPVDLQCFGDTDLLEWWPTKISI